jgi:hypothetical protein
MEQYMLEMLIDPHRKIAGKHVKQFSGTIDADGAAISFHYKYGMSGPRRLSIVEAGKSCTSRQWLGDGAGCRRGLLQGQANNTVDR